MNHRNLQVLSLGALIALAACGKDDPVAPVTAVVATPITAPPMPVPAATSVLDLIALPVRPEAIARGNGTTFYAGSTAAGTDTLINGMIVRGDFKTGVVTTLVPAVKGKATSGLVFDPRSDLLWATETRGGAAGVYNATTGAKVTSYTFTGGATGNQINDVALGPDAVYFSNSFQPVIFRVALGADGAPGATFSTITLSGDYVHHATAKPFNVNGNGIAVTANGQYVLLDNMGGNKGVASANCMASPRAPADSVCVSDILRVDPASGVAKRINFGTTKIYTVDGIRLYDRTLYVAQNFMDRISVFTLSEDYLTATFVKDITSPNWVIPSSLVVFENSVFAVNFGGGPGPYQVSRMPK